jgi:GT2 family glycosyltransferase
VGEKLEFVKDFGDRLIKVDGCGFGVVLVKTEVLKKSFDEFRTCFQPIPGFGEDLSFCVRAKKLGYKLFADPNIEIGHIGKTVITKNAFRRYDVKQSKVGIEDNN